MSKGKVYLNQINDVKNFVSCVSANCSSDVTLRSGRQYIDAKSLLGVFSLDLSKPVDVEFTDESDYMAVNDMMSSLFVA